MEQTKICISKTCAFSGIAQPMSNFYKNVTIKNGRTGSCKECVKIRARELAKIKRDLRKLPGEYVIDKPLWPAPML